MNEITLENGETVELSDGESLELTIKKPNETIFIFRHGVNDYSIGFDEADYSLRGSLLDIVNEFCKWKEDNPCEFNMAGIVTVLERLEEQFSLNYDISENRAFIRFGTDSSYEDCVVEFEYNGSPIDFVDKFRRFAYDYDVDEKVVAYYQHLSVLQPERKGKIEDLLKGCNEVKKVLLTISDELDTALASSTSVEEKPAFVALSTEECEDGEKKVFDMKMIEDILDSLDISHQIEENFALIEFWTDTADQDIPTSFEYDGTPEDFVEQFSERAEAYDVDEEVELYASMRGKNGVPETIKELMEDCKEAKDTLMEISEKLKSAMDSALKGVSA